MIITALIFSGCVKRGEYVSVKGNDNFEAALIFEVDNVKVYRFLDAGRFHYFVVRNTAAMLESAYTVYAGTIAEAVE
jgi:hypothetical protein